MPVLYSSEEFSLGPSRTALTFWGSWILDLFGSVNIFVLICFQRKHTLEQGMQRKCMTIFPAEKILPFARILSVKVKLNAWRLNICVGISHITMWCLRKTSLEYGHLVLCLFLCHTMSMTPLNTSDTLFLLSPLI